MSLPQFDGRPAIARGRHHRHVVLSSDGRRQPLENEHMIVGDQESNLFTRKSRTRP
jgi:hypothetical protein